MTSPQEITADFDYSDEALLRLWRQADAKLTSHQEYFWGDRKMTLADAAEVTQKILFYESRINAKNAPTKILARMVRS